MASTSSSSSSRNDMKGAAVDRLGPVLARVESEELLKCQVCFDDASGDPVIMTCRHQHLSCFSCVFRQFQARARSRTPVRCPTCRHNSGGFIIATRLRRMATAMQGASQPPQSTQPDPGPSSEQYFACMDAMAGRFPRTFRHARSSCIVSPHQMSVFVNNYPGLCECVLGRGTLNDMLWRDANNRLLIRVGSGGSDENNSADARRRRGAPPPPAAAVGVEQQQQQQQQQQHDDDDEEEEGGAEAAALATGSLEFTVRSLRDEEEEGSEDDGHFREVARVFLDVFTRVQARRRMRERVVEANARAREMIAPQDRQDRQEDRSWAILTLTEAVVGAGAGGGGAAAAGAAAEEPPPRYSLRSAGPPVPLASPDAECFLVMALPQDSALPPHFRLMRSIRAAHEYLATEAHAGIALAVRLDRLRDADSSIDEVTLPMFYAAPPGAADSIRVPRPQSDSTSALLAWMLGAGVLTAVHLTHFTRIITLLHRRWDAAAGNLGQLLRSLPGEEHSHE
jgi:hypothetical protein